MRREISLTSQQRAIMNEFYNAGPIQVIFNHSKRKRLWNEFIKNSLSSKTLREIKCICPAMYHQICKHQTKGGNLQSAVFSECVYAQTLANILGLKCFLNCYEKPNILPKEVMDLLNSYSLVPRYAYTDTKHSRMLIQAGGCGGIDSALITVIDFTIYTIEFKEPAAKASEPDLPKYDEKGNLKITTDFIEEYPQFKDMLTEQKDLNFFSSIGHNIGDFSSKSIETAIVGNYTAKKFADVVCTEDQNGFLVMLPINQVPIWATIEGEIRPAGRNHCATWTPKALIRFLCDMGATIKGETVHISASKLTATKPRGGQGISRYKINSLFFIRAQKVTCKGSQVAFSLSDVRQLIPTITAKMFFKTLNYSEVSKHYFGK